MGRQLRPPIGGGAVDVETDDEGAVRAGIAVGDASVAGKSAADRAEEEMLVVGGGDFGQHLSTVTGDVNGLGKFERDVIGVRKLDEHFDRDAVFGPVDTHVWGHGCASTS